MVHDAFLEPKISNRTFHDQTKIFSKYLPSSNLTEEVYHVRIKHFYDYHPLFATSTARANCRLYVSFRTVGTIFISLRFHVAVKQILLFWWKEALRIYKSDELLDHQEPSLQTCCSKDPSTATILWKHRVLQRSGLESHKLPWTVLKDVSVILQILSLLERMDLSG